MGPSGKGSHNWLMYPHTSHSLKDDLRCIVRCGCIRKTLKYLSIKKAHWPHKNSRLYKFSKIELQSASKC